MKRNRTCLKILRYRKDHPFVFYFLLAYLGGIFIYILIFHVWFADYSKPMPLNEVGDFLAGVFSPLAFLFLYIGYKQNSESIRLQNEELKASTKALELQVKEMQESVEQQKKLVEIQNNEILGKHISVQPYFNLFIGPFEAYPYSNALYDEKGNFKEVVVFTKGRLSIDIQNNGEVARHIRLIHAGKNQVIFRRIEITKGQKDGVLFDIENDEFEKLKNEGFIEVLYRLEYSDIYGKPYKESIKAGISRSHKDKYFINYQIISA